MQCHSRVIRRDQLHALCLLGEGYPCPGLDGCALEEVDSRTAGILAASVTMLATPSSNPFGANESGESVS